jgi:drug/metabolite transporter (DMT)-like permease
MEISQSTTLHGFAKPLGVLCAVVAAIGFSGKAILVKLAYPEGITAVPLLTLRMLFSVPVFLLIAALESRKAEKLSHQDLLKIAGLGFVGYYLSSLFDFMGLQHISAGLERLILFLYPTFVVILSALFFRRPVRPYQIGALILCYSGIGIVYFHESMTENPHLFIGSILVLTSCLTYSGYLIGAGEMIRKVGATRFTAYAMLVSSIVALCQYAYTSPLQDLTGYSIRVYELSLLMAVFSTVLPVFCLAYAIKQIGAGNAAMIGSLGPVATILMAACFLNEPVTVTQMAGSILVLLGVSWVGSRSNKAS